MRNAKEDRVRLKIIDSEPLHHVMNHTGETTSTDQAIRTSEEAEGKRVRILSILDFYP